METQNKEAKSGLTYFGERTLVGIEKLKNGEITIEKYEESVKKHLADCQRLLKAQFIFSMMQAYIAGIEYHEINNPELPRQFAETHYQKHYAQTENQNNGL